MIAYLPAAWSGFGATVAEVAATLAGLLFVAVSINLRQILAFPNLPGRAAATLITFATVLAPAAVLLALISGLLNAWVLLVEILR